MILTIQSVSNMSCQKLQQEVGDVNQKVLRLIDIIPSSIVKYSNVCVSSDFDKEIQNCRQFYRS